MHRDVKPENLLLCAGAPGGHLHVRLADFGLARRVGSGGTPYVGTLDYMAPEVKVIAWFVDMSLHVPRTSNTAFSPWACTRTLTVADQLGCDSSLVHRHRLTLSGNTSLTGPVAKDVQTGACTGACTRLVARG